MGVFRALLAITVVLAHSPWHDGDVFVGGPLAVQLFYMISGFLIHHVLVRNQAYKSTVTFYKSRLLRILPVYYAVALASLLLAPVLVPGLFAVYAEAPMAAEVVLISSNLLVFGQDWIMFTGIYDGALAFTADFKTSELPLHQGLLIPQAWTLGLELSFYAVAPFLLRKRALLLCLLAASLALRVLLCGIGVGERDPWSYRFFPTELSLFILGALSNRVLLPCWLRWSSAAPGTQLPGLATLGMLVLSLFYFVTPLPVLLKMPLLFLISLAALPLLFSFQNQSELDRSIGELSYPIYIGHMLVIRVVHRLAYHLGGASPLVLSLVNVCGAILFGLVLNACIARPMERLRARVKAASWPGERSRARS